MGLLSAAYETCPRTGIEIQMIFWKVFVAFSEQFTEGKRCIEDGERA